MKKGSATKARKAPVMRLAMINRFQVDEKNWYIIISTIGTKTKSGVKKGETTGINLMGYAHHRSSVPILSKEIAIIESIHP